MRDLSAGERVLTKGVRVKEWWSAYFYYACLVLGIPMAVIAALLLFDWLQHL